MECWDTNFIHGSLKILSVELDEYETVLVSGPFFDKDKGFFWMATSSLKACVSHDLGPIGTAVNYTERQLVMMKEINNAIRTA
jgi:hypothetical protein